MAINKSKSIYHKESCECDYCLHTFAFKKGYISWNKGRGVKKGKAICRNCGKEFEFLKTNHTGKFCNMKCYSKFRKLPLKRCIICGKNIEQKRGRSKFQKFCSQKCMGKSLIKGNFKSCDSCGELVWVIPCKNKIYKKNFCGRKCYILYKKTEDKKIFFSEENIKKRIFGLLKRPTSFEEKISNLCLKYNLPFVYKGNGGFLINYKNPDFVNEKDGVVIEVFYSWFKIRDYGGVENYKKFCRNRYEKSGWKVIFIDELDLNCKNWEEICLNKIKSISESNISHGRSN
jgi:endogenous inhibitor of DNA gyrase (YacG/DUF329 family)